MKQILLSNSDKVALVDDEDFELVSQYNWTLAIVGKTTKSYYAITKGSLSMHVLITSSTLGFQVDHINHNGLDNRKENLRLATSSQNAANSRRSVTNRSSKYRGVNWEAGAWRAKIYLNGKRTHLGRFANSEDAAKAYDDAARILFGEFAMLNFPNN